MERFTERVLNNIKSIPKGKVTTFGQIAKMSGNPRSARQVARLLHTMSEKHQLPWHRVINSQGKISLQPPERQAARLVAEGVEVRDGIRISLKSYQWDPTDFYELWMNG